MAVASLVLGIIALVVAIFGGFYSWIGIVAGVIGIVLAAVAKKKAPSGVATAGLVLSIIAAALSLVLWLACAACVSAASSAIESELGNLNF